MDLQRYYANSISIQLPSCVMWRKHFTNPMSVKRIETIYGSFRGKMVTDSEPEEYRMKVHLFGAASSPGCANYGMKYLASQAKTANLIKNHFYVDDGLVSVESAEEVSKLVKKAQAICAQGNLHLHKCL